MTKWLPVTGYTLYEVSDDGRVRTNGKRKDGRKFPKKEISQSIQSGYPFVSLYVGRKCKRVSVHRLVVIAFIGPCPKNKHQVNHKDGNKLNPNVENLEWVTRSENSLHAIRMGLQPTVTKGAFKKGNRPWNAGKKTGQRPWNYRADRSCSTPGCKREFYCRGKCDPCHRRSRYLAEQKLLPTTSHA